MTHRDVDMDIRKSMGRDFGRSRSTAPGSLAAWAASGEPILLKEVIAIIRPQRWPVTKARVQRLRIPAFTQQRVLGRGAEGGLWTEQASGEAAVRYLPKRMISWVVEAPLVPLLVQAIVEANYTGQPGDGKIFVLPVDEAVRVRTGEQGLEALKSEIPYERVEGTTEAAGKTRGSGS